MGYLVPGLVMWLVATVVLYVNLSKDAFSEEGETWVFATLVGLVAGLVWPLTLVAGGVFLLARRIVTAVAAHHQNESDAR